MHGACGFFGPLFVSLFHQEKGVFYGGDSCGFFFLVQLLGVTSIALFSGFCSLVFFSVARKLNILRVDMVTEVLGLDLEGEREKFGIPMQEIRIGISGYYDIDRKEEAKVTPF